MYMAKTMALVLGIILVLVGILGFVTNPLVGAHGLFMTNGLQNLLHLVFGVVLVIASRAGQPQSATWLKIIGVLYLILAILGFLMGGPMLFGLIDTTSADKWLYVVLGVVLVLLGIRGNSAASQPAMPMA